MNIVRKILANSNALVVFACAAQHANFTRAGKQLGMTQASVSYFIKQLEQNLGTALFHRQYRKVQLTEAGERLYQNVGTGLSFLQHGIEQLQLQSRDHVTISSSTAFASYWLLPRMMAFRKRYPQIDLRIQTSDKDVNLAEESISLGVRLGDGDWKQYDGVPLYKEEIYVVAKADYFNSQSHPTEAADLLEHQLIHLDEPFRPRISWADWFKAHHVEFNDRGEGLRLNDYALVIQAVLEGQGIAFGWRHLVERLIQSGLLIKVLDASYISGKSFYLIWDNSRPLDQKSIRVRDWMLHQV